MEINSGFEYKGHMKAKPYLNLAGYCFFDFKDHLKWRYPIRDLGRELGLRGTVLCGPEGVNIGMAGLPKALDSFLEFLHGEVAVPRIGFRRSWSEEQPFSRFLVKIKPEIVTLGQGSIPVAEKAGGHLPPKQLKQWLDEGRDFTFIDTRNDFEIKLGKFVQAEDLGVRSFREFAEKAKDLPEPLKKKPLVMYCTGGIRCEKAAVYFKDNLNFEEVYQLEGGILNYFDECGPEHYEGECFVFDKRIGLNADLDETSSTQCYQCRSPLLKHELPQGHDGPVEGCVYCQSA